jgi:hypothetical protein
MRFQGLCKVFEHELELFRSVTRWNTLAYIRKHTCQKMHTALCAQRTKRCQYDRD